MAPKGFSVDLKKAVGHEQAPYEVAYNRRDLILYALAVGVAPDELHYLYELDPKFTALPTYALVLQSKGAGFDVNSFADEVAKSGKIAGLPEYDLNNLVHGEQGMEVLRPIPLGGKFSIKSRVAGVYDKGSGMVIDTVKTLVDDKNTEYVKMTTRMFVIGYGGWGGPKGPSASNEPLPSRQPDAVEESATNRSQALLYRLSGDYNPLHADPAIAPMLGFKRPILHGLCSYGTAAHAVIKHMAGNEAARFKSIHARFSSPVYPGETLVTSMWKVSETGDEETIRFVTKIKERDAVVIKDGIVTLSKAKSSSKL
ncbi:hypothetical protein NQZ79_g6717 [Umbelopsis isabellina]|nr:hypothetical protein NQZ79_g6717 [Umbelopsis isabellina]